MNIIRLPIVVTFICAAMSVHGVRAESAAVSAMSEYMTFSTYDAGIIIPEQIDQNIFESAVFIDARDSQQYKKQTIPGAMNIEWREVLERIDEIPEDKTVIMFCNTGTISSQATFALRVSGRTNVLVLQTGITGWLKNAAYRP